MDANAVSSLTLGNQGQNLQHAYCMWEVHGYLTTGWRVLGSQTLHGVENFNIYPLHPIAMCFMNKRLAMLMKLVNKRQK